MGSRLHTLGACGRAQSTRGPWSRRLGTTLASAVLAALLGCGGDDASSQTTCGAGTTLVDGRCVATCGPGTSLDASGVCVPIGQGGASGSGGSGGAASQTGGASGTAGAGAAAGASGIGGTAGGAGTAGVGGNGGEGLLPGDDACPVKHVTLGDNFGNCSASCGPSNCVGIAAPDDTCRLLPFTTKEEGVVRTPHFGTIGNCKTFSPVQYNLALNLTPPPGELVQFQLPPEFEVRDNGGYHASCEAFSPKGPLLLATKNASVPARNILFYIAPSFTPSACNGTP